MSDPTLTIDDLTALPEKMRAHAAAKAVGMTSKEFLAAMSGIGVEIKSAQSAVTRETLLTWFEGRDTAAGAPAEPDAAEPGAAEPGAADPDAAAPEAAPAKKAPAKKAAAKKAPAKKSTAAEGESEAESEAVAVQADESAPGAGDSAPATKAPRKRAPRKTAAQKAAEAEAAGDTADAKASGTGESSTRTSSQERPVLPSIAIVTGEVGTADTGNRRRRSTATPSFSPLFLSADDSAQTGSAGSDSATTGSSATGTSATAASSDESGQDAGEGDDQSGQGEGRRRRRGRRGRGRGRGEGADDQNTENNDDDENSSNGSRNADSANDSGSDTGPGAADSADGGDGADGSEKGENSSEDDSDASESTPSGSRRRRRRRRRGGGSGTDDTQGSSDDPPNTEIHERDGRRRSGRSGSTSGTSEDEVQGITGSTRLEAKRQRRRDGREAGRRRQPILSESEFLARRESVDRVMVVREKPRDDGKGIMTQVGVLEDKVLVEHFVTTESARSMVGNVYLGRVQNVLPSMEAAFVDIGRGRNGVLYAGEVNWEAAGLGGKARRIEQALKPGDMVLVQVTKDPVGQKGARLSTQISLAGRFLVYVPDGNSAGISRKLPDTERRRLKAILKDVVPEGSGVIIRTAAEGVSEEEIKRDVDRLAGQWTEISEAADKRKGSGSGNPVALYEEPDLLVKVVRDLFNEDFTKLVIQGGKSWDTVHSYVSRVAPEMASRLERYDNPDVDVFTTHRVDEQLAKALERKVWLPSGGSLVIDRTEAMTVIDVNTGKYTGSGGNLEETVTKNNLEAAEEIVRQLRLRDVGGMVVIDFIDMVLEANRDLVLRRLTEALGRDRTRHQVSEVTSLGLVQLTRKKLGTGLVEAFSTPCEHCHGRGLIVHADPIHTESHNADEPGSRRGRRRGGKGSDSSSSSSSSSDGGTNKPAPRRDGPAPGAHPAALAMRHDDHRDNHGDQYSSHDAPAEVGSTGAVEAKGEPAAGSSAAEAMTTAGEKPAAAEQSAEAEKAAESSSPATDAPAAGSTGSSGNRRPTRRRATRRAPAAPSEAATTAAEAGSDPATTVSPVRVEPAPAPAPAAEPALAAVVVAAPAADSAGAAQSGRRPRRRSSRREAGAAATTAGTPTGSTDEAPTAKVAAATLAQAPKAVVAEPRQRPARRRATRSTTAPEGD
ncbi:hypothetical protein NCCP2495_06220 [Dietzia sp. NCCP-2495]|uniref:Rne/Rng family ribonuclease n=1 Tax=Dietzia sp. NCCP-2495 TaxID=2934675 RepID=UPI00222E53C3|nr:Rne/Rng family ribonuclease [Dietzia sp. NCCP-2495]GLB62744.1 hypothetical protein NCCP2495_06220 [Dietzia sp. NCCP-2495]